jgi:hypothetical protein
MHIEYENLRKGDWENMLVLLYLRRLAWSNRFRFIICCPWGRDLITISGGYMDL